MGKYSDYTDGAIGMEGSDNWPLQWSEDCDESFKEYKKQIDAGKKVDADTFLDKQKVIFSKMSKAERKRCNVDFESMSSASKSSSNVSKSSSMASKSSSMASKSSSPKTKKRSKKRSWRKRTWKRNPRRKSTIRSMLRSIFRFRF